MTTEGAGNDRQGNEQGRGAPGNHKRAWQTLRVGQLDLSSETVYTSVHWSPRRPIGLADAGNATA